GNNCESGTWRGRPKVASIDAELAKNLIHPSSGTSLNYLESVMKLAYVVLRAASAATFNVAANANTYGTDEARAEAHARNVEAERAAALQPITAQAPAIHVTDTDSARAAGQQANARRAHDAHLAEVLRAGHGIKPPPIKVTDTDSARLPAGQADREQTLVAQYDDLVKSQVATAK